MPPAATLVVPSEIGALNPELLAPAAYIIRSMSVEVVGVIEGLVSVVPGVSFA